MSTKASAESSPPGTPTLHLEDWGRTAYRDAAERQAQLVARRISGEIGDTLIFTEHEPVYTVGLRSGAENHLVWASTERQREGITVEKTNRGGDITYHGPGQIVGYPIVSLATQKDLHAYLRLLEEALIRTVSSFGLSAARREGKTGIWIERRKIAAIGVAVRRWVAYHGFALNVNVNLGHFSGIVPCGISPAEGEVTSLQRELGRVVDEQAVKAQLARDLSALLPELHRPSPLRPTG